MMKAANLYTDAVTDQITVQEDVKFFDWAANKQEKFTQ